MIQFALIKRGIFRLAKGQEGERIMVKAGTDAWTQALSEFAAGHLEISPADRIESTAFGRFGYSNRTEPYQRQQLKANGAIRPFYSPRRALNWAKAAEALLTPSTGSAIAALKDLARQQQPRLASQILIPGIGWAVRASGKTRVVIKLVHPAAKMLNYRPKYAREFADLKRGGQLKLIRRRAQEIFDANLATAIRDRERA